MMQDGVVEEPRVILSVEVADRGRDSSGSCARETRASPWPRRPSPRRRSATARSPALPFLPDTVDRLQVALICASPSPYSVVTGCCMTTM